MARRLNQSVVTRWDREETSRSRSLLDQEYQETANLVSSNSARAIVPDLLHREPEARFLQFLADQVEEGGRLRIWWLDTAQFQTDRLASQIRVPRDELTIAGERCIAVDLLLKFKDTLVGTIPLAALYHDENHLTAWVMGHKINDVRILNAHNIARDLAWYFQATGTSRPRRDDLNRESSIAHGVTYHAFSHGDPDDLDVRGGTLFSHV